MSLLGWLKVLDDLAPRCERCNRKIRNGFKCKSGGAKLCSESCFEKHLKLRHAQEAAEPPPAEREAPKSSKKPLLIGCAAVFAALVCCCGIMVPFGMYFNSMKQAELREADEQHAAGNKQQVVAIYQRNFRSSPNRPEHLKRIVQFELARDSEADARKWIERGIDDKVSVVYDSQRAKDLLVEIEATREADRVGKAAKKKVADEKTKKEKAKKKESAKDDLEEFLAKYPPPDETKTLGDGKRLIYRKARIDVVFIRDKGTKAWRFDHFADEATPYLDIISREEALRRLGFN